VSDEDFFDDVAVVLLAAGSGERLGGNRPKAFVGLAGETMLAHSLRAFEEHEAVDSIVLVVPEDWIGPTEVLVDDLGCDKVTSIEIGGASRAASVRAGMAAVGDRRATAVLVHDAARPRVPASLIDRVLSPIADGWDAVVPALPVTDTIKRMGEDGAILETMERSKLCAAQTPQCCRASALHAALDELDDAALAAITDDAQAVELAGGRVRMVVGDPRTTKITTAADLAAMDAALLPLEPVLIDPSLHGDDEHPDDLEPLDEDDLAGTTPHE
jgi:2-C-methyl-D-erythritol 4-phosphate cytidylyltransferase